MAHEVAKNVLIYLFLSVLWAPPSDAVCSSYFLCYISNTFSHLNELDPDFNDTAAFMTITNQTWNSYDEACDEVLRITNIVNYDPANPGSLQLYCNSTWNTVSCWPRTLAGTTSNIPCPHLHQGIDFTRNASRECDVNGTWAIRANYSACTPEKATNFPVILRRLRATHAIFYVGFSLSTVSLVISIIIFRYFRSLRCVRTLIHCNLMLTFVFRNILFIILSCVLTDVSKPNMEGVCKMLITFYQYFTIASFFWMFIEGLYLYFMIVHAMRRDRVKFIYCIFIGWVGPVPFVITWIILKKIYEDVLCWLPGHLSAVEGLLYIPIITSLCVNFVFFFNVLCVLICQLRQTEESAQYKKAAKASGILIPLLGITYLLFLVNPGTTPASKEVFQYINAILQAAQGLLVSILYCFMNGDVRAALAKKVRDHMETRSVTTRYTQGSPSTRRTSHEDYHLVALRTARVSPGTQDNMSPQWESEDMSCADVKEKLNGQCA